MSAVCRAQSELLQRGSVQQVASIAAGDFDHYILKRDDNPRGRKPDEVPKLLEAGLLAGGDGGTALGGDAKPVEREGGGGGGGG